MDLILGHSYEGDRPRNRADCGLHSLPMDGPGSDLHLAGWRSRDVRLNPEVLRSSRRANHSSLHDPDPESVGQTKYRCAAECAVRFEPMCANTGFFATSTRVLPCGLGCGQVLDFRWCSLLFNLLRCDNS